MSLISLAQSDKYKQRDCVVPLLRVSSFSATPLSPTFSSTLLLSFRFFSYLSLTFLLILLSAVNQRSVSVD